jgi:hypothetical protein
MIDERINRNSMVERLPKWILPSISDRSGKFDSSFRSVSQVRMLASQQLIKFSFLRKSFRTLVYDNNDSTTS